MPEAKAAAGPIVLVAEDETLVRLFANDALTDAGFRVLEARDGQEALTILEAHPGIRALLTDVMMPNLTGTSLVVIVSQRWPEVAIVVTSALPRPPELPAGVRFLAKPYTVNAVVSTVEAAMAEKESAVPVALKSLPTLQPGTMHGAGGLAQPLMEPDE
jgi:two-component system, response regulator PdtaR